MLALHFSSTGRAGRVLVVGLGLSAVACVPLTREEARASLEEAQLFAQASSLLGNSVELSSNFTIGGAVEDAAENLREFYAATLPCAEVSVEGGRLSIEYGARPGNCSHRGMSYSGTHELTISRGEGSQVRVTHRWIELSNERMVLSGTAQVTWNLGDDPSRRIVHDLSWLRLADDRAGSGTGDRTQRPLGGDIGLGFVVSGEANWQGESGLWELESDEVEMRWIDPVPQSGSYLLGTPFDKTVEFTFERTSPTNVRATAKSGDKIYEVDVKTAG